MEKMAVGLAVAAMAASEKEREFIYQVHIHNIYISIITMAGCQ